MRVEVPARVIAGASVNKWAQIVCCLKKNVELQGLSDRQFAYAASFQVLTGDNGFMPTNKPSSSDSGYKHLFSCPEMVRDLLIGFAPGKWIEKADFSTLVHVNGSYVSESEKQRFDDTVWRVNVDGQWLWLHHS